MDSCFFVINNWVDASNWCISIIFLCFWDFK